MHHGRFDTDRHREHAGDIDADVFDRQGAAQRDFDLDRFQIQVGIILQKWNDERRPAMHGPGCLALSSLSVNDQYAVTGATFVLL